MLLLDRNNEPTSTVYYLSALVFDYLVRHDGMDAATLYQHICSEVVGRKVGYDFFVMALDFLFLLDRIGVDEKGGLHVYQVIADLQYGKQHSHA